MICQGGYRCKELAEYRCPSCQTPLCREHGETHSPSACADHKDRKKNIGNLEPIRGVAKWPMKEGD